MAFLERLLGRSAQYDLSEVFNKYIDQWPENHTRYHCWKPASLLSAPKWVIKKAMKLAYLHEKTPIAFPIFSAYCLEFTNLALHLSHEQYDIIEKFRKGRIRCCGEVREENPLLGFEPIPNEMLLSVEFSERDIIRVRDKFQRSVVWDPIDADDDELADVRGILLASTAEYAALCFEWHFYITSIGRDEFVEDAK